MLSLKYTLRFVPYILFGEDAIRFQKEIEHPEIISNKERKAQEEAYQYLKSIATFHMP